MKKCFLVFYILSTLSLKLCAQNLADTSKQHGPSHFVGVQANALFRQIFNFSNANNPINNPYLLTYTCISKKSKLGVDLGVGYTLNQTFQNDGNTKKENNINDLFFRIGIQKLLPVNKRFTSILNLHILFDLLNDKTKTESDFSGQLTKINTTSSAMQYGVGPCVGLRYRISNRVFIGTEASYYFKMGVNKSKIETQTIFNGQVLDDEVTNSDNNVLQFMFNVPTALYLILRF